MLFSVESVPTSIVRKKKGKIESCLFSIRHFSSTLSHGLELLLAMEVAIAASTSAIYKPMLASPTSTRIVNPIRALNSSSASPRASLCTNFVAPFAGNSVSSLFSGQKLRPSCLNPASFRASKGKRGVVTMVPLLNLEPKFNSDVSHGGIG